jgi:hypothetical protein
VDKSPDVNANGESPGGKRKYLRTLYLKNSSPVMNWVFDDLLEDPAVPHAARSVLLFLIRKTVGWDNREQELSLREIEYGASVSRPIAIHALWVFCDCWGLFIKKRGWKGQHSSVYEIGDLSQDNYADRTQLILRIYDTTFPTPEQVRAYPKPGGKPGEMVKPKELHEARMTTERQRRDEEERARSIAKDRGSAVKPSYL